MSATPSRLLRLLVPVLILFSAGDAFARKLVYAMPPTPAIAEALAFKVMPPVPVAPLPEGVKPKKPFLASADPLFLDDEHRIGYRQEFGGGGLAVGLLLGPLGAAANAKAVQAANERETEALRGKFPFTPGDLLGRALAARPGSEGATVEAQLAPSLFITRDANEQLIFWAMVDVSIGEWRGRYNALMQGRVPLADASKGLSDDALRDLESALQTAYAAAVDAMADDVAGRLTGFDRQRAKIPALWPRFDLMQPYDYVLRKEDRVFIRTLAPGTIAAIGPRGAGVLIVPVADVQFGS
ncbi:MAG: hypothetical protein ACTHOH_03825 [Lysobacteraceae bacterium]